MKRRYFLFIIVVLIGFIGRIKALEINNCQVMLTFKQTALESEKYVCKGKAYGSEGSSIYYSGKNNVIYLNGFNAYYVRNEMNDLILNIEGKNQINYFHVNNGKIEVIGKGLLKFKDNSYVGKYNNGSPVYRYIYNGKVLLNNSKEAYEGTYDEFVENYEVLVKSNDIPKEYQEGNFKFVAVVDYQKIVPVAITNSWITQKINTKLKTNVSDGYGIIEYKEPNNELQSNDLILISKEKVDSKYELTVDNIKNEDIGEKVSSLIEDNDLVSFYNVSIVDGTGKSNIKKGNFTIKFKLNDDYDNYEDYQIIYVDDNGNIKEYINSKIEDGYIVFDTSHLSYYGVIGKGKFIPFSITINEQTERDNVLLLKVTLLVGIILMSLTLLAFVIFKSKKLSTKRRKKNRFVKFIKNTLLSK